MSFVCTTIFPHACGHLTSTTIQYVGLSWHNVESTIFYGMSWFPVPFAATKRPKPSPAWQCLCVWSSMKTRFAKVGVEEPKWSAQSINLNPNEHLREELERRLIKSSLVHLWLNANLPKRVEDITIRGTKYGMRCSKSICVWCSGVYYCISEYNVQWSAGLSGTPVHMDPYTSSSLLHFEYTEQKQKS